MQGISGWLLFYLVGTIPIFLFWSAGLCGWFLDYPLWLFLGIFIVFLAAPAMLLLRAPSAPTWNITNLWVGAVLISARVVFAASQTDETLLLSHRLILGSTVAVAMVWAAIWTRYFLVSDRVARIFS